MNFWPLSTLATSPFMPGGYALELQNPKPGDKISQNAANACFQVAYETPPVDIENMAFVENIDGSAYYVFTEYPNYRDWARLERGGITVKPDGTPILLFTPLN